MPYLPFLQAALQSKRMELRASVADGLRAVFQQQQQQQQQQQEQQRGRQAAGSGGAAGAEDGQPEEEAVWVHNGFLDAYASVRSEVLRLLQTALAGGAIRVQHGAACLGWGHGRWYARVFSNGMCRHLQARCDMNPCCCPICCRGGGALDAVHHRAQAS